MSESKLRKTDKKLHPGKGGSFLKFTGKLKGYGFYNSAIRNKLKRELYDKANSNIS